MLIFCTCMKKLTLSYSAKCSPSMKLQDFLTSKNLRMDHNHSVNEDIRQRKKLVFPYQTGVIRFQMCVLLFLIKF